MMKFILIIKKFVNILFNCLFTTSFFILNNIKKLILFIIPVKYHHLININMVFYSRFDIKLNSDIAHKYKQMNI